MSQSILKTKISEKELKKLVRKMYSVAFEPQFVLRKLLAIKSWKDHLHHHEKRIRLFTCIKLLSYLLIVNIIHI